MARIIEPLETIQGNKVFGGDFTRRGGGLPRAKKRDIGTAPPRSPNKACLYFRQLGNLWQVGIHVVQVLRAIPLSKEGGENKSNDRANLKLRPLFHFLRSWQ
jgi:hypothetical protein